MELALVAGGALLGMLAALPVVMALRSRGSGRLGRGVISVIAAFVLVQGVLLALAASAREAVPPVGIAASLVFLVVVLVAALRTPR